MQQQNGRRDDGHSEMLQLQGLPFIAENGAVIQLDEQWQDHEDYPRIINGSPHADMPAYWPGYVSSMAGNSPLLASWMRMCWQK
jgi:Predicted hydrolase (HAD superfamily)